MSVIQIFLMKNTIHIVMDTPGANALQVLQDATSGDNPPSVFLLHENCADNEPSWKLTDGGNGLELDKTIRAELSEIFIILSHNLSLPQQIEAVLQFLNKRNDLTMGRFLLFLHSPILLDPPENFPEWLDGVTHFTDVMLFIDRSNDSAGRIKEFQERYRNMHYPMESYILGKKNDSWYKILDPTPRRISHIFDDPELLEPEDLPENDRYLVKLPSGERKRVIPLIFCSS